MFQSLLLHRLVLIMHLLQLFAYCLCSCTIPCWWSQKWNTWANNLWWNIFITLNLTFIGPCIANIFSEYNQKDATFHNFIISVRRSTWFRRFFCPLSGAQNCKYSVRYLSDQYCYQPLARSDKYLTLYVQFWAPDYGRKNRLKRVERLTEINKLWNVASCWLYSAETYFIGVNLLFYFVVPKAASTLFPTFAGR
jgi:hypothetical protein